MWATFKSSILIGFTGNVKCQHCNNETPMQVRQVCLDATVLFIPLGTSYLDIFLLCPVCEKKYETRIWWKLSLKQDKKIQVVELLNEGKVYTKHWVSQLDKKGKEKVQKRLNALKAYDLVKYIG